MILNPDDALYRETFTQQELDEIRDLNSIDFDQDLPKELHDYFYSFKGKVGLQYKLLFILAD